MQPALRRLLCHSSRKLKDRINCSSFSHTKNGFYSHMAHNPHIRARLSAKPISHSFPGMPPICRMLNARVQLFRKYRANMNMFQRDLRRSAENAFTNLQRNFRILHYRYEGNTLMALLLANCGVFLLLRLGIVDPGFLARNFTVSIENIRHGRLHTLITSSFTHVDFSHLLMNLFGLYFFGSQIQNLFGAPFLLKLYLSGAVGGSVAFLVDNAFLQPWLQGRPSYYYYYRSALGASGAVTAIMLLDIFLFPKAIHYLYLVIPLPGILVGGLIIGADILRVKEGSGEVAAAGHLGGALVAVLAWARIRRRMF